LLFFCTLLLVPKTLSCTGAMKHKGIIKACTILLLLAALAKGAAILLFFSSPADLSLDEAMARLRSGDEGGAYRVVEYAQRDWPTVRARLGDWLTDEDWRVRCVAGQVLGGRTEGQAVPSLLALAHDCDWRVRAAAFDGLSGRLRTAGPVPHQNTPIDQRQQWILQWTREYDGSEGTDLSAQWCEILCNGRFCEVGQPMVGKCLSCHAGKDPVPQETYCSCARCHAQVHKGWAGSAHANSLTHLKLTTVESPSRQARLVEFGAIKGIGCAECHGRARANAVAAPASSTAVCEAGYVRSAFADDSCARCHAQTQAQWKQWTQQPHPVKRRWPPGQIDLLATDDHRTCVDCHMPAQTEADAPASYMPTADHSWSARRSREVLAGGVVAAVVGQQRASAVSTIRLTNFSGHAYPTGSSRRALAIVTADEGRRRLLLSPETVGWSDPLLAPAMKPGEVRTLDIPMPGPETQLWLRYLRNWPDPNAYVLDMSPIEQPASHPATDTWQDGIDLLR